MIRVIIRILSLVLAAVLLVALAVSCPPEIPKCDDKVVSPGVPCK